MHVVRWLVVIGLSKHGKILLIIALQRGIKQPQLSVMALIHPDEFSQLSPISLSVLGVCARQFVRQKHFLLFPTLTSL